MTERIAKSIDTTNVIPMLLLAQEVEESNLLTYCYYVILKNSETILNSKEYKELVPEEVKKTIEEELKYWPTEVDMKDWEEYCDFSRRERKKLEARRNKSNSNCVVQ